MKIAVSFLKSKYNLIETIDKINNTDVEFIHVDIMDGDFVPNKSFIPTTLLLVLPLQTNSIHS